ncbi:MAG TPA: tetratricopeptide repeat-containing protein, partial [Candidatus Hydrogenedentes bacterium]|nr:tetratricopeptide repeat-containing protein [Candidatus Hydrogenedentota bacterium]
DVSADTGQPELAECLDSLGMLLTIQILRSKPARSARWEEEAERLFLRALKTYEALYGSNHQKVGGCLSHLVRYYNQVGRPADALPFELRAMKIKRDAGH